MIPLRKRWQIAAQISPTASQALQGYPSILRQILYNRGYTQTEQARIFLEAKSPPGTSPENLLGLPLAADRINFAIKNHEPIAIYGDYDVDGVTATALLVQALSSLQANVRGYIPNRFDEGYGLNIEALESLHAEGVRLVITVDCGIRSWEEATHARLLGLDLIITDHHHPLGELPQAFAIIDPKQMGDAYPDKDLAGVGLAYKMVSCLMPISEADSYLDLVALGTVADLAPLVGENRALVRSGLGQIRLPQRQGIMALIGVSGLEPRRVTASDIGYVLGPRLNAAGRLDSALAALELLTTAEVHTAAGLAQKLETQNRERQQLTRDMQVSAEEIALTGKPEAFLLFAAHPEFNPGVVGLVASRLCEQHYRPAIVAHTGDQLTRGSCRSIPEFHITDALDRCAELMEHHGGHAAAAGFTVRNENLPELIRRLEEIAHQQLSSQDLRPTLQADMQITLEDLKPELLEYLGWLQPTGYGNRPAIFVTPDLKVKRSQAVGRENAHLKLSVTDGWITYDAIAFRQGHWLENIPPRVDLAYTFEKNEYNGRTSLQLNVADIKPAGEEN